MFAEFLSKQTLTVPFLLPETGWLWTCDTIWPIRGKERSAEGILGIFIFLPPIGRKTGEGVVLYYASECCCGYKILRNAIDNLWRRKQAAWRQSCCAKEGKNGKREEFAFLILWQAAPLTNPVTVFPILLLYAIISSIHHKQLIIFLVTCSQTYLIFSYLFSSLPLLLSISHYSCFPNQEQRKDKRKKSNFFNHYISEAYQKQQSKLRRHDLLVRKEVRLILILLRKLSIIIISQNSSLNF